MDDLPHGFAGPVNFHKFSAALNNQKISTRPSLQFGHDFLSIAVKRHRHALITNASPTRSNTG